MQHSCTETCSFTGPLYTHVSASPGHSPRKQWTVSNHSPLHSEPPYEGPLHSLVLCMVPLAQEAEHRLQLDHSFHTPSTNVGQGPNRQIDRDKSQSMCEFLANG